MITVNRQLIALLTAGILGTTLSAPALADIYKSGGPSLYAGANYTFLNVDGANGSDADVGAIVARVGGKVTPFFGLEARGGFGVTDDRIAPGTDLDLNSLFGGYATLNLDNESPATPYAILGFSRYEFEVSNSLGTAKDDDSDFSYGIGVDLDVTQELSANLEYMRYGDQDDVTLDGIAAGLTFRF